MSSYLELLHLEREPFSNSPDPDNFYPAEGHQLCLNRLEISIRLHRGLNLVYAPVGTGKSTMCRKLFAELSREKEIDPKLMLDTGAGDALSFARGLLALFAPGHKPAGTVQEAIDALQAVIFEAALEKGLTSVLLIDEGQKLTDEQLEILRVLLNFETNTEKLLQIVVFAQPEILDTLNRMPNFKDRVNEFLALGPLTLEQSEKMIRFRLNRAGLDPNRSLFSKDAVREIHRASGGRPRQMVRLAHLSLLSLIMSGRQEVDAGQVRGVLRRELIPGVKKSRSRARGFLVAALLLILILLVSGWLLLKGSAVPELIGKLTNQTESAAGEAQTALVISHTEAVQTAPAAQEKPSEAAENGEGGPSAPAPGTTPAAPAATPVMAAVNLAEHLSISEMALLFYGTENAAVQLRAHNPRYEEDEGMRLVNLPLLNFERPAGKKGGVLLSFISFGSAQDAYEALSLDYPDARFFPVREGKSGDLTFCVVSRTVFSSVRRARAYLTGQSIGAKVRARYLTPRDLQGLLNAALDENARPVEAGEK